MHIIQLDEGHFPTPDDFEPNRQTGDNLNQKHSLRQVKLTAWRFEGVSRAGRGVKSVEVGAFVFS